ncbi:MAG: ATP-binding cassette domain-containing protein [Alphaproteobacteria bacterium]|nr:MAG: ATP-binding cassette domain-containing protein [Alphaproteobacteria bacterium]
MALYDHVIPAQSTRMLGALAAGVAIAFAIELGLRLLRAQMLAYLGARLENLIATGTFGQLLRLPAPLLESAAVGTQAARLKEFDSIRDLVTGPMVSVGLELPFVALFLAVIAWLGGPLAYIPLALIALYAAIGAAALPALQRGVAAAAKARAQRHAFNVEMMTNARAIKQLAVEGIWLARYRALSAEASFAHFRTAQLSFLLQTLAQAIMMGAGIATIVFGTLRVMAHDMSIGALIAVMALVWRVLSPLQNLFLALTRFEQAKQSVGQLDQLMRMPTEERARPPTRVAQTIGGALSFERVSFRYRPDAEPALLGVSLRAAPGSLLGITGGNGAGKSTVLALAAGLYRPQAGIVAIDGVDIRQMDSAMLRRNIAYVAQDCHMFHGSIAQNLRLGHPTASDRELEAICADLGILDQIRTLPDGLETRIGDQRVEQLNVGFKQRLSIARALLRRPALLLLDEAARALDFDGDKAFARLIAGLRGKTTVVMVSHRPSHLKLCDRLVVLAAGTVVRAGKPADVLGDWKGATA